MDRNILKNRKAFRNSFKMFAFVSAFSFAFLSCDGIAQKIDGGGQANPSETKEFIVSGTFSLEGAVPSEIASLFRGEKENVSGNEEFSEGKNIRTAVPSVPELSGLFFNVTATKSASSSVPVSGEVLRGNSPSFTVKLSEGEWTLKADAFSDSGKTKKVLSGTSAKFSLSSASPVKTDISIILSPVNEGSGKVSLPMGWTIDSGIKSVKITFEDLKGITKTLGTNVTDKDFEGTLEFDSDIQSGSHTAKLEFYAEAGGVGTFRYSTHEVINVFQNLTTDTWQGNAPYFTETDGKTEFKITKPIVDDFRKNIDDKIFYVAGTNPSFPVNASDSNDGTNPFRPFETLQKAVDKVNSINDGTSAYKIYVDGTLEITSASEANAVSITPEKNLNLTIEGTDESTKATIRAKSTDMRVFRVGKGATQNVTPNVTMKNLIITGGNNETGGGAGIKLEAGNLTLSNVEVTGNSTTAEGGGIYVGKGAALELDGSVGKVSITPAEGDTNPIIYLEKGQMGRTMSGGSGDIPPMPDAVLKLGGNIQIGNGSDTGIKMDKMNTSKANIKITKRLTGNSSNKIYIHKEDVSVGSASGSSVQAADIIIEQDENCTLTAADLDFFTVIDKSNNKYSLKLEEKDGTNYGVIDKKI